MSNYKIIKCLLILGVIFELNTTLLFSQACSSDVIEFNVDLTNNKDSLWNVENVLLQGNCCSYDTTNKCIKFNIKISIQAKGVILKVYNGNSAISTTYKLLNPDFSNCLENSYLTNKITCINSETNYMFAFCTNNLNYNKFSIKSVSKETNPRISLSGTYADGCRPFEVNFYDSNASQADNFLWNFGDGNSSNDKISFNTYENQGIYNVSFSINYGNNCSESADSIKVNVNKNDEVIIVTEPEEIDISAPIVNFSLSNDSIISCLWNFGDGDSSEILSVQHTYADTASYVVSALATNIYNCTNIGYKTIRISAKNYFEIPNAFTPNPEASSNGLYDINDHNNYVFYPIVKYVKKMNFEIYNRWGELIFISNDLNIGWDGYYKGVLCKQDVYVWKIDLLFENGEFIKKSGYVTLLR